MTDATPTESHVSLEDLESFAALRAKRMGRRDEGKREAQTPDDLRKALGLTPDAPTREALALAQQNAQQKAQQQAQRQTAPARHTVYHILIILTCAALLAVTYCALAAYPIPH